MSPLAHRVRRLSAAALVLIASCLGFACATRAMPGADERPECDGLARERVDSAILTGVPGREVRPGEWIELSWSGVDGVRELELLLSIDGGAHYHVEASTELAPETRRFRWKTPNLPGRALRLLVRYNKDGREIEGQPTEVFAVSGAPGPVLPLGLPPCMPSPTDRSSERTMPGAVESESESEGSRSQDELHACPLPPRVQSLLGRRAAGFRAPDPLPCLIPELRPRFVPLRP